MKWEGLDCGLKNSQIFTSEIIKDTKKLIPVIIIKKKKKNHILPHKDMQLL